MIRNINQCLRRQYMRPHAIVLIIGGIASLVGIIAFVFGIAQIGDLEEDWNDFAIEGKENGEITIEDIEGDGDLGVTFWVKGVYEDIDQNGLWDVCDNTNVTVIANPDIIETWAEGAQELDGEFYFEGNYEQYGNTSSCDAVSKNKEISRSDKGLVKIGRACYGCTSGTFAFEANQSVWVTYDDEVLRQLGEGALGAGIGFLVGCGSLGCGILFLIIGAILAFTKKDQAQLADSIHMVDGTGAMVVQVPSQAIPTIGQVQVQQPEIAQSEGPTLTPDSE